MSNTFIQSIRNLIKLREDYGYTAHWKGCHGEHVDCALAMLLVGYEQVQTERNNYRDALEHILMLASDGGDYMKVIARDALDGEDCDG